MIRESVNRVGEQEFSLRKLNSVDVEQFGDPQQLVPGDIAFIRWKMPWWKVISKLVVSVDTFFSHAMIYVGNDSFIESSLHGVTPLSLDELNSQTGPGSCVVIGRPSRPLSERKEAANWAAGQARDKDDKDVVAFDSAALATAFVVLAKQRVRGSTRELFNDDVFEENKEGLDAAERAVDGAIERMRNEQEEFDDPFEAPVFVPGVCAAFVWQAYARVAERPLAPCFLEGTRLKDGGRFSSPAVDPTLLEVLLEEAEAEMFGLTSHLGKAEQLAHLLAKSSTVLPALAVALRGRESTSIAEMLGPADLCFSPDIGQRFFLRRHHKLTAQQWQAEHRSRVESAL